MKTLSVLPAFSFVDKVKTKLNLSFNFQYLCSSKVYDLVNGDINLKGRGSSKFRIFLGPIYDVWPFYNLMTLGKLIWLQKGWTWPRQSLRKKINEHTPMINYTYMYIYIIHKWMGKKRLYSTASKYYYVIVDDSSYNTINNYFWCQ